MDAWKRATFCEVGPGGVRCPCCCKGDGKSRRARRTRRRLKVEDRRAWVTCVRVLLDVPENFFSSEDTNEP